MNEKAVDRRYIVTLHRRLRNYKLRQLVVSSATKMVEAVSSAQAQRKAEAEMVGWSAVGCMLA